MRTLPFILILFIYGTKSNANFPKFINPCKKGENLNKCLLENINLCKPHLKDGIPKLFIPSLDPLYLPMLSMKNPGLTMTLRNLSIYMSEFEITEINFDLVKNKLFFKCMFNPVRVVSKYEISGKLLMFELNTSGDANANFTKLLTEVELNLRRDIKDGREHLVINKTKIKENPPESFQFDLTNLFGQNEELTKQTMKIIAENGVEIFEETHEIVDASIMAFLDISLKNIFNKYSVDDLFSD